MNNPLIELKNIVKDFPMGAEKFRALQDIGFSINEGELVALIGASGCGKSTTMNILGLLSNPTAGEYYLDGKETSKLTSDEQAYCRNQKIGFVFQSFFLLNKLTALDNVMLPLLYRDGVSKSEARELAVEKLTQVKMDQRMNHKPHELSGGQKQRVAIARALIGKPSIILADEPTGALDSQNSAEVMDLLKNLHEKEKATLLIVTHDSGIANQCQRKIFMKDGKIVSELQDAVF
ncbi:MAG TPA: ABC transporter ATP-binding protein [Coxiellaceae bacterium]|nr:ABC transporter ATP-binding protein [Coxiellaceae bacterium]